MSRRRMRGPGPPHQPRPHRPLRFGVQVSMGRVLVLGSLRRAFKFVHGADTSGTGESRCGTGPRTAACVHWHSHDLIESLERRRLHRYIANCTALARVPPASCREKRTLLTGTPGRGLPSESAPKSMSRSAATASHASGVTGAPPADTALLAYSTVVASLWAAFLPAIRSAATGNVRWARGEATRGRPSPVQGHCIRATASRTVGLLLASNLHHLPHWYRPVALGLARERTANLIARKPVWRWQFLADLLCLAALPASNSDSGVGSLGLPGESA